MPDQKDVNAPRMQGITRGPMPASRKVFVPGLLHPDLRVPLREISQTPTWAGAGERRRV